VGRNSRGRSGYLSGTDEERIEDFAAALGSESNDAIWCLRGGYGTLRIIDRVDWTPLLRRPRPLIGFSDNTVLHLALRRMGLVSFHGPHPAGEDLPEFSSHLLRRLLTETAAIGTLPFPDDRGHAETLVPGVAEGPLVGGNLVLLGAAAGTPWALQGEGCILFFEEVGEASYRLDRLLTQLRLTGALHGVRGVVIGALSDCPDEGSPDTPPLSEMLLDRLGDLGVPIARGFPFGHQPENWTLPVGVRARLDATAGTLALLEPAVEKRAC
jgi:muramoyltetrapeptide carboxypeptidase